MVENIQDGLLAVYEYFDGLCKQMSCFYDITTDEQDLQCYALKDKSLANEIHDKLLPIVEKHNVHMEIDNNRKNDVLFKFTMNSIQEGHWQKLSKHPKRSDLSIFANQEDARKVRSRKSLAHLGNGPKTRFEERLGRSLYLLEKKDRPLTVAVDLDGTLAKMHKTYNAKSIPKPRDGAKEAMDELQKMGVRIIINTVRGDKKLIKSWLVKYDIPYDYINENPDQPPGSSDKIIADVYIDDRSENGSEDWSKIMGKVRKRLDEDQYKSATGKYRRSQSMFRSSFGKSKTFGGLTEGKGAVCGSSIPIQIEPASSLGLQSAQRSNSSGEKKKVKSYKDRKDLTDLPTTVEPGTLEPGMLERIDRGIERATHGSKIGRTNDPSKNRLGTRKAVPGPENNMISSASDEVVSDVVPDDTATKEREKPFGDLERKVNLRPLGLFGPADKSKPSGGPVSNVRVQHPPDRSPGASEPKIQVNKSVGKKILNGNEAGEDPLNMADGSELVDKKGFQLGGLDTYN